MKIKKEIKKYFPWILLSFLSLTIIDLLSFIPPMIMQKLIDETIPSGNMQEIIKSIVIFISIPLCSVGAFALYKYFSVIWCRKLAFQLNRQILLSMLHQNIDFHREQSASELAAQCNQDAMQYIQIWLNDVPRAISSFISAVIALGMLFSIRNSIAISQLFFIPVMLIPALLLTKVVRKLGKQIFDANTKVRSLLNECFRGIRTIKTLCVESYMTKRYQDAYEKVNSIFGKTVLVESVSSSIGIQLISSLFTGVAFAIGISEIIKGNIQIGQLVACLGYLPKFQNAVSELMMMNLNFFKQLGQFDRLFEYMNLPDENLQFVEGQPKIKDDFINHNLCFSNIFYSYPNGKEVLKNKNLDIIRGKWIGIEGTSGSGKSTFLDIILRLILCRSGNIQLDGENVCHFDLSWYRKQIAYVPQTPFLFTDSIRAHFMMIRPYAKEAEIWHVLQQVKLNDFIQELPDGLDTVLGEDGTKMSGGQKQRLALAIALFSQRPLLILDEATSQIDAKTERDICEMLHKTQNENNLTILSVSHRPAFHKYAEVYHFDEESKKQ